MKKYTFEQYIEMSKRFNKLSFEYKIKALINNSNLFGIANDHNWWWVEVLDTDVKEILKEEGIEFELPREWDTEEILVLLEELKVNLVGC